MLGLEIDLELSWELEFELGLELSSAFCWQLGRELYCSLG